MLVEAFEGSFVVGSSSDFQIFFTFSAFSVVYGIENVVLDENSEEIERSADFFDHFL